MATEFTIRLVEVPIKVQLPPRIPAKEMGISNLDSERLKRLESSDIILINTITTAVVLINAEIVPVINIKLGNKRKRGRICIFFNKLAKELITPLSSKAKAIINKERTVMVAVFENPEIASSGETKPDKERVAIRKNAILSKVKTSNANRTIVTIKIEKTSIISVVIYRGFSFINILTEMILVSKNSLKVTKQLKTNCV